MISYRLYQVPISRRRQSGMCCGAGADPAATGCQPNSRAPSDCDHGTGAGLCWWHTCLGTILSLGKVSSSVS